MTLYILNNYTHSYRFNIFIYFNKMYRMWFERCLLQWSLTWGRCWSGWACCPELPVCRATSSSPPPWRTCLYKASWVQTASPSAVWCLRCIPPHPSSWTPHSACLRSAPSPPLSPQPDTRPDTAYPTETWGTFVFNSKEYWRVKIN